MTVNMVAVASMATPSVTVALTNSKTLTLSSSSSSSSSSSLSLTSCFPSSNSTRRLHPSSCSLTLRCGASSTSPNSNSTSLIAAALGFDSQPERDSEPLQVMISGAPASGKGTQCELIKHKYGLVHVAAGDLLRAEIATGSDNGKLAKQYMEKGQLVPDHIVVMMVKDRLLKPDAKDNGWLLDGYPRSLSQATALKQFGFQPDIFVLLEVSEDILVERVVGRRLDPVTGKIYHLKYSPPENEEIAARLTQRFDDTEEKVKLRLNTHHQNVEAVLSMYKDITVKINGNVSKEEVFAQIDSALTSLLEQRKAASGSVAA
ncbi:hypothetical protein PIB30_036853 [Stylosanthes scabra]|uniref:adenylate kinase n=1 Tax=Stylosanthes scabra TaxID=79078 RepID=A0ABU6UE14_9FABA|nr:hypothetical protein [Stylosanthes scabra]